MLGGNAGQVLLTGLSWPASAAGGRLATGVRGRAEGGDGGGRTRLLGRHSGLRHGLALRVPTRPAPGSREGQACRPMATDLRTKGWEGWA